MVMPLDSVRISFVLETLRAEMFKAIGDLFEDRKNDLSVLAKQALGEIDIEVIIMAEFKKAAIEKAHDLAKDAFKYDWDSDKLLRKKLAQVIFQGEKPKEDNEPQPLSTD